MTEKIVVEFTLQDGKRDQFLANLQELDQQQLLLGVVGYRADDYVSRREALVKFVDQMEMKLRRNEHKRNWEERDMGALLKLLLIEVEKFRVYYEFASTDEARPSLVDISNWSLMLWDRMGRPA